MRLRTPSASLMCAPRVFVSYSKKINKHCKNIENSVRVSTVLFGLSFGPEGLMWLLKTEPSAYGYDDLEREGKARWDGVTNPVALKNIRAMKTGDRVVIY